MPRPILALIATAVLASSPLASPPAAGAAPEPGPPTLVTAPADSLPPPSRVVRRFEEIVVRARREDPFATHSSRVIDRSSLIHLPVDRLADALALQTGVVAQGGALHVRGGRAGEAITTVEGMPLTEPFRGAALEVPLSAVRTAELQTGALEARHPGALAGVAAVTLADPPARPALETLWEVAPTPRHRYDRVGLSLGSPLPRTGLGVVADLEGTFADPWWRDVRSRSGRTWLGMPLGWRASDRELGRLRLARIAGDTRVTLDVLGGRVIDRPYDPAWSLDGWTGPCDDPYCNSGPIFSPVPTAYATRRYNAADHLAMTDARHRAVLLDASRPWRMGRARATAGWLATRAITSVGGRDDESYITGSRAPEYGLPESVKSDPFHVYSGDEPYFRRRVGERAWGQTEWGRAFDHGSLAFGASAARTFVSGRRFDHTTPGTGYDSVRVFRGSTSEWTAWGQSRWISEGLVVNLGVRAERFRVGAGTGVPTGDDAPAAVWSLSPRLGIAYPLSVRDVFSLAYARVQQSPPADLLFENRGFISNREPLGNPALIPSTVITYEVAVRHLFDRGWSLQFSTFFRDLFDVIGSHSTRPAYLLPQLRYENVDEAQVSGVEGALRHESERLSASLTYTWMDARGTLSREEGVPFGPLVGSRAVVQGQHPLDWDQRHTAALALDWRPGVAWSLSWITEAGSGLPWSPRQRRALDADVSLENSRRFAGGETSALAARWTPRRAGGRFTLGLDVRNVFDSRRELAATVDGYPNPLINTRYDDYGAFRTETGLGGGAYWNDRNDDGVPGWVRVHDPRLTSAPRSVRFSIATRW
jgi:outer membrane receptor protein involved in Fe transport